MNNSIEDDEVLELLRHALHDGPSDEALRVALGAPAFGFLELALLDYDSFEQDALLLRSDAANERAASFSSNSMTVEFEILEDTCTVVGQILPPDPAAIEVVQFSSTKQLVADESGRFTLTLDRGPLRFDITGRSGRLTTPWLTR
jgi:hypothetical protein